MDAIAVEVAFDDDPSGIEHILCGHTARNQAALDRAPDAAADGRGSNDVWPHRQGDGTRLGCEFQAAISKLVATRRRRDPACGQYD